MLKVNDTGAIVLIWEVEPPPPDGEGAGDFVSKVNNTYSFVASI